MTADLSALIARLEAAEVGSRELDHLIFMHTAPMEVASHWSPSDRMTFFTTSLDAALALAERVLPADPDFRPATPSAGWKINIYRGMIPTADRGGWFVNVRRHATDGYKSSSESPALALCTAILRAKQGEGE